jgi:N-acetylneuraminate synthase
MYDAIPFGSLTLRGDRPFLVAEAGVNHENDLAVAIEMVDQAAAAGADAIKFQSYKAETLASKNSPSYWDLGSEPTTSQFELFKKYDRFGDDEYAKLARRAEQKGIVFMSTPFDRHFADALEPLMPAYKIASADLTNTPFLRHIAAKKKPMILSVGASTLGEVDAALTEVRRAGDPPIALLHCVLSYPCKPEDANLRVIGRLREIFSSVVVGYSDHVPPAHGCLALTTAWLLGARILEKHFTLDKTKPGNDHYHAFDPDDVREFRAQCDYATALLGRASKDVLPCEEAARKQARRSLVATTAIAEGTVVTPAMVTTKRPGTGIAPQHLELVVGSRALRRIEADDLLQWDMFLARPPR